MIPEGNSPPLPAPWCGVAGPCGSFLLPFPCGVVTGDLLLPRRLCGAGGGQVRPIPGPATTARPQVPFCPSGHGPHLDSFHAVLGGLGRHTLDLRPEPLPAEGHSHVPALLDLRSGQHTPVQVVGQPCECERVVTAYSPAAGASLSMAVGSGPWGLVPQREELGVRPQGNSGFSSLAIRGKVFNRLILCLHTESG